MIKKKIKYSLQQANGVLTFKTVTYLDASIEELNPKGYRPEIKNCRLTVVTR